MFLSGCLETRYSSARDSGHPGGWFGRGSLVRHVCRCLWKLHEQRQRSVICLAMCRNKQCWYKGLEPGKTWREEGKQEWKRRSRYKEKEEEWVRIYLRGQSWSQCCLWFWMPRQPTLNQNFKTTIGVCFLDLCNVLEVRKGVEVYSRFPQECLPSARVDQALFWAFLPMFLVSREYSLCV